jgi:hypothetical protein
MSRLSPNFEHVKQAEYQHPSPGELVDFKIMGIHHRTAGL